MLQSRSLRGAVLSGIEGPLLIFGVSMFALFSAMFIDHELAYRMELHEFRVGRSGQASAPGVLSTRHPIDFSLWSASRIASYRKALAERFGEPLAVLRIPTLSLEAPVLEGTDELVLNRGVGHIAGTALPWQSGTVGIAGHRDSFFRALKDVQRGVTIELESGHGVYLYRVDQIFIVDPTEVSVLQARPVPSLTLVTCYPFYFFGSAPQRYIVQASLVQSDAHNNVSSTVSSSNLWPRLGAKVAHSETVPQNSSQGSSTSIQEISQ